MSDYPGSLIRAGAGIDDAFVDALLAAHEDRYRGPAPGAVPFVEAQYPECPGCDHYDPDFGCLAWSSDDCPAYDYGGPV